MKFLIQGNLPRFSLAKTDGLWSECGRNCLGGNCAKTRRSSVCALDPSDEGSEVGMGWGWSSRQGGLGRRPELRASASKTRFKVVFHKFLGNLCKCRTTWSSPLPANSIAVLRLTNYVSKQDSGYRRHTRHRFRTAQGKYMKEKQKTGKNPAVFQRNERGSPDDLDGVKRFVPRALAADAE